MAKEELKVTNPFEDFLRGFRTVEIPKEEVAKVVRPFDVTSFSSELVVDQSAVSLDQAEE